MRYLFYAVLFFAALSTNSVAKGVQADTGFVNAPPPPDAVNASDTAVQVMQGKPISQADIQTIDDQDGSPFQSFNFLLAVLVLLFGLVTLFFINYKIRDSFLYYKCVLLTLIIVCTIVLVVAGYSNASITGASGILGGISGYLIGKTNKGEDDVSDKNKKREPKQLEVAEK